jgi:Ca2+/Na+ antiporter
MKKLLSFFGLTILAFLSSVSAASCAESPIGLPGTITLDIIPLILFLTLIFWGLGHKSRKKAVHRVGFILILLEIILAGVVLFILDGQACIGVTWIVFPSVMVLVLTAFIMHRDKKEKQTRTMFISAREKGYIRPDVILDEELVAKQKEEAKARKQIENLRKKAKAPKPLPPLLSLRKDADPHEELTVPTAHKKTEEKDILGTKNEKPSFHELNSESRFPLHGHMMQKKEKELSEKEVGGQIDDIDGPLIEHELSNSQTTHVEEDKEAEDKHTAEKIKVEHMPVAGLDKKAHAEMDKIISNVLGKGEKEEKPPVAKTAKTAKTAKKITKTKPVKKQAVKRPKSKTAVKVTKTKVTVKKPKKAIKKPKKAPTKPNPKAKKK